MAKTRKPNMSLTERLDEALRLKEQDTDTSINGGKTIKEWAKEWKVNPNKAAALVRAGIDAGIMRKVSVVRQNINGAVCTRVGFEEIE